ncbi:hypothetical protein [Streptomyces reticuliscabiei]|uniref:hypothetical protein n=1 Tax=Streptomyces reticuliscabiei TaxID=146821 RepID=UPI000A3BEB42|nr:hypothetical protein [Streptomyces reticuliscabiei]
MPGMLPNTRTVLATPTTDGATAPGPTHASARSLAPGGDTAGLAAESSVLVTPVLVTGVL